MIISDEQIILIMNEVVRRFLLPEFKRLGMNATGEWLASVETSASNQMAFIRARDYTEYLVNGRRPGKRPPIAPLERWAQAKLGLSGIQATSAAYGIANKIAQEGTTWYQQGGSDLLEVLESDACINFIQEQVTSLLTIEAKSQIEQFLEEVDAS